MGKAYAEYTFSDAQRLDLAFLVKDKEPDIQEAQKGAFNYIIMMAGELGLNAMTWKMMEMFDVGTGKDLITDRNVINKRLFAFRKDNSDAAPVDINSVIPTRVEAVKDALLAATKRDYSADIKTQEHTVATKLSTISSYERDIRSLWPMVATARDKIVELRKLADTGATDDYILGQIIAIEATGEYKFLKYCTETKSIVFGMTKPCFLSYKRKAHGIDIQDFNMGYFGLTFHIADGYCSGFCGPYTVFKDRSTGSARHPHLGSGANVKYITDNYEANSICWGNIQDKVNALMQERNYVEVTKLYKLLMNTYCHDNPYQPLGFYKDIVQGAIEKDEACRRGMKKKATEFWSVVSLTAPEDGKVIEPIEVTWNTEEELKVGDFVYVHDSSQSGGSYIKRIGMIRSTNTQNAECEITGDRKRYNLYLPARVNREDSGTDSQYNLRGEIEKITGSVREFIKQKLEADEMTDMLYASSYKDYILAMIDDTKIPFIGDMIYRGGSSNNSTAYQRRVLSYDSSRITYARYNPATGDFRTDRARKDEVLLTEESFAERAAYIEYLDDLGYNFTAPAETDKYICNDCESHFYGNSDSEEAATHCCDGDYRTETMTVSGSVQRR